MRQTYENGLEEQLLLEARLQGNCGQTRDFKEGVIAFLEKRAATYEGR
jgi:2-(1,2-epoxy-1,2-dihydrophenyl)acetyl-CoA isomerase